MGTKDRIRTLEALLNNERENARPELARLYIRVATRKSSRRLFWAWFDRLRNLLEDAGLWKTFTAQYTEDTDPLAWGWQDLQDRLSRLIDQDVVAELIVAKARTEPKETP